jgi:putative sigma-54 modulation protein
VDDANECDVHLTVNKNPKVKEAHKAEVVTYLKGSVIRCAEETPDMYASIDAVTDRLAQKLKKYKEKRLEGYQSGTSMGENLARVIEALEKEEAENEAMMAAASSDEDFEDPEAPVITNIKSYDLTTPITVEEAIFALGYVDHNFFVFREKETNEVSVVYLRNAGGYGLINATQKSSR